MNGITTAELPHITVDLGLNGITISTAEYCLGHFSSADGLY